MNNGVNQGSSPAINTGNPQSVGMPGLQPTQSLQGPGSEQGVLGLNTLNQIPNSVNINVPTSETTEQSEVNTSQPMNFNVPPLLVTLAVVLLVAGIVAFIWGQRHSADPL